MSKTVHEFYGHRLRTRVCAICLSGNSILMIKHRMDDGDFWSPPGGGLEYGESATECVLRELHEEARLKGQIEKFLFVTEFFNPPLHAIELFFSVLITGGKLGAGIDPEVGGPQLIAEAKWMTWAEIKSLDPRQVHGIFKNLQNLADINELEGYFKL